jgi:hypothetical protein
VCAGDRARRAVADHDQAPRPFLDAYVVCHVVEHLTPVMLGGGGGDTPARCAFLGLGATNLTETFTARVVGSIVSIVDAFAGIWDDVAMGDCEVAQAVELVRALRQQLHEMTYRLTWLESHQDVTGTNGQASAIRCEAAAPAARHFRGTVFHRSATAPLPERRRAAARNGEAPCLGTDLLEVSA